MLCRKGMRLHHESEVTGQYVVVEDLPIGQQDDTVALREGGAVTTAVKGEKLRLRQATVKAMLMVIAGRLGVQILQQAMIDYFSALFRQIDHYHLPWWYHLAFYAIDILAIVMIAWGTAKIAPRRIVAAVGYGSGIYYAIALAPRLYRVVGSYFGITPIPEEELLLSLWGNLYVMATIAATEMAVAFFFVRLFAKTQGSSFLPGSRRVVKNER